MAIVIRRESVEPIYQQLVRHFRTQIESGHLPPGERLPPTRDLARQLGVGRVSVVHAYAQLREEGLVVAWPGRGTFVAGQRTAAEQNGETATWHPTHLWSAGLREMTRLAQQPGVIAFNGGAPPDEFLPVEALRQALNAVLSRDGAAAVTYEEPQGYQPLRQSVAGYVSSLGIQCSADDVLITGGTQQALDLVVQTVLSAGDGLVTGNPTYLGILDVARVRRMVPVGVPVGPEGMRLDALENVLRERRPALIYVTPTYHNPTGTVMPLHRRRQLLALAAQYGALVLEDAVYHELGYQHTPPPPPLKAIDEDGVVIHASGFSKILLPGTRIGYLIASGAVRERLVRLKEAADVCTPGLNQRAMQLYLASGALSGHLQRVRAELHARCEAACAAAESYFPQGTHWNTPGGGLYLWVRLPDGGPTAAELYATAIQHGVAYAVGTLFHTDGSGGRHIRLNFAAHPPARIAEGFKRLGAAWHAWQRAFAPTVRRAPIL